MISGFQEFASSRLTFSGLAGWAARLHEGAILSHCLQPSLTPDQLKQALSRALLLAGSLPNHGIQPVVCSWLFEHLVLVLALREEGASLLLLLERRENMPVQTAQEVLHEFASLPTG